MAARQARTHSLAEMVDWLAHEGHTVTYHQLAGWFTSHRITTGSRGGRLPGR